MIVGIDNGKNGHIALYNPPTKGLLLSTVPLSKSQAAPSMTNPAVAKDYDILELYKLFETASELSANGELTAVIEKPYTRMTVTTARTLASLNYAVGIYASVCALHGIKLYQVSAQTWKSKLKLFKKPKEAALELATSLRPSTEFPTVDAADAFLLAYFFDRYRDEYI